MLKRRLAILSVAFASVVLVVMHAFPHHHHGEAICFAAVCSDDGHHDAGAGKCPHHHSDESGHHDTCSVEDSYLFSFEHNDTKCKAASCHQDHHPHAHLFPMLCLTVVISLCEAGHADEPPEYGEWDACLYHSAYANRDNGLRAPPCLSV